MFPLMSLTCLSFSVRAYLFPFSLRHSVSFASSKLFAALWIIKLADFVFCLIVIYKLDTARCFGLGPLTVCDQASVNEEKFVFKSVTNYLLIHRMLTDNIQSCNTKLRVTLVFRHAFLFLQTALIDLVTSASGSQYLNTARLCVCSVILKLSLAVLNEMALTRTSGRN